MKELIIKCSEIYRYIKVKRTCLGAILLVFAISPNHKLFLRASLKNFILFSGVNYLRVKLVLYILLALSKTPPTLPKTLFLARYFNNFYSSLVSSSYVLALSNTAKAF